MSISKLTTKVIGDKRRWRAYQARSQQLPESHRAAVKALERYLILFGPGDGDGVSSMMEDLTELFEQAAADGTSVRAVVGEDPREFADQFLRNYPEGWTSKERQRLSDAIDRAAGTERHDAPRSEPGEHR